MNEDPRQESFPTPIEEQLAYFMRKASTCPSKDDPMGMVQFGATLVAARLAVLLLQAEPKPEKEQQS